MGTGNVFETISQQYYELTASEKKTADYLMAHQEESQYMSIAELAEESGVAEATISRFCRRLGYKGYNAFKLAIANSTAHLQPGAPTLSDTEGDSLEEGARRLCAVDSAAIAQEVARRLYAMDSAAIAQTLELLDYGAVREAADLLERAERVCCMGQGGSMLIASEAAHLFSAASGKFFAVSDSHMQMIRAANMGERDAVLFFSYSGATRDMVETLQVARERGARIILITRFPKSPGGALADVVLRCGANESPLQIGSVAAKLAQLFLLDVLYAEFCRRAPGACEESRERIAAALAEKHL